MMKTFLKIVFSLLFFTFSLTSIFAQSADKKILKVNYRSTQISQYSMTKDDYKPGINGYSTADVIRSTNHYYSLYLNLEDRTSVYLHDSTIVTPTAGSRATVNVVVDFTLWSADQKMYKMERFFDEPFYSSGSTNDIKWNITNEVKEINGMKCYKAKAEDRDLMSTAYFTKEIPVSSGPSIYHGFPGLVVWVEDYFNTTELTNIEYLDKNDVNYDEMYSSFLADFNDKENRKYKLKERELLLNKVGTALYVYEYKHGEKY